MIIKSYKDPFRIDVSSMPRRIHGPGMGSFKYHLVISPSGIPLILWKTVCYLFMFDWCRRSQAEAIPVKWASAWYSVGKLENCPGGIVRKLNCETQSEVFLIDYLLSSDVPYKQLGPSTIARNTALARGRRAKQPEVGTDLPWRLVAHCWLHCTFGHSQHF